MAPLVWLVTGCSSGFGEQFVDSITARGDKVIATGRNASERLNHIAAKGVPVLDVDVSASQDELNGKVQEALKIFGTIDVLVNNAGFIQMGTVEEIGYELLLRSFNTNFFGPINLTRALLPHFRERRAGTIAFVGSRAGWSAQPDAIGYCASKFALEGLIECLSVEVAAFGIKTVLFEPGVCRTEVFSPRNVQRAPSNIEDYKEFTELSRKGVELAYGNETGDPKKTVEMMIDVVKGEGKAKGMAFPLRLPLGSDTLDVVRDKCQNTLKLCDEWESAIKSVDI